MFIYSTRLTYANRETFRGGGGSARLKLFSNGRTNLTVNGPARTLKIQGFDHKSQDFWSDQGRSGRTDPSGPVIFLGLVLATGWISKEGLLAQIYYTFFWKLSIPSTLENFTIPDGSLLRPTKLSTGE